MVCELHQPLTTHSLEFAANAEGKLKKYANLTHVSLVLYIWNGQTRAGVGIEAWSWKSLLFCFFNKLGARKQIMEEERDGFSYKTTSTISHNRSHFEISLYIYLIFFSFYIHQILADLYTLISLTLNLLIRVELYFDQLKIAIIYNLVLLINLC